MPTRRRLAPEARRAELLEAGAALFAERPYDEVTMEEVARRADVSRALLYRHFPTKRDLLAAVYRRATRRLFDASEPDPTLTPAQWLVAGLDAHIDYFLVNRNTVLAANRTPAGDPMIQAVISDEPAVCATECSRWPGSTRSASRSSARWCSASCAH
jgi:AcrR family transcriptional regulator